MKSAHIISTKSSHCSTVLALSSLIRKAINHTTQSQDKTLRTSSYTSISSYPFFYGNHSKCVVILMEEKSINYYNSIPADQTRLRGKHKEEFERSILEVMLTYLKDMHNNFNKPGKFSSSDWDETKHPNPLWLPPRQDNDVDCGVFVCMYINFIHDSCQPDFSQADIIRGQWQKKMMLLMITEKSDDKDKDEVIVIEQEKGMEFPKEAKDLILNNKTGWRVLSVSSRPRVPNHAIGWDRGEE
jgi:hypothetical protein